MRELLDIYSDYLISSFGSTTATGLSSLLNGSLSHDQITRFLAGKQKGSADLWQVVKRYVREIEGEETYAAQQEFLAIAARLAKDRRLSRFLYVAERVQ